MNSLRQRIIKRYKQACETMLRPADFFGEGNNPLRDYQQEKRDEINGYERISTEEEVAEAVRDKDLIYVADYHPLKANKLNFLDLIEKGRNGERQTIIALEEFEQEEQRALAGFLRGQVSLERLLARKGHDSRELFKEVLEYSREKGLWLLALDKNLSLRKRDENWATLVSSYADRGNQIFLLAGENHLAEVHLPGKVRKILPQLEDLIVLQNEEEIFWQLMEQGLENSVEAVKIKKGVYCINHVPPLLKKIVYTNSLEEKNDKLENSEILEVYTDELRKILRISLRLSNRYDSCTKVFSFHDQELTRRLMSYGRLDKMEDEKAAEIISLLNDYAKKGRSITLLEQDLLYLASDETRVIAEEVAHSLRQYREIENPYQDSQKKVLQNFYATVLEEAIGYLGSKLFDPAREPFVMAEIDVMFSCLDQVDYLQVVNPASPLFDMMTHTLGEELGETIHQRLEEGEYQIKDITKLFRRRFNVQGTAQQEYRRLMGLR